MDKPKWLKKGNKDLPWIYPMEIREGRMHGVMQVYNFDIDIDKRSSSEVRDAMKWIDEEMKYGSVHL